MNTCEIVSEEITDYIEENFNKILDAFVKVYGEKHRKTIETKLSRVRLIYTYNFPKLKKIEVEYLTDEKMRIVKEALSKCSLNTQVELYKGNIKVVNTRVEELFMKLFFSLSIIPNDDKDVITPRMIKGILRKNNIKVTDLEIESLVTFFNEEHRKFFEGIEGKDHIDLLNMLSESLKEERINPNKFIGFLGSNIKMTDGERFIFTSLMENLNKTCSKRDKKEGKITYNMAHATPIEKKDVVMFNPFDMESELDLTHELNHIVSTTHLINSSEGIISKIGLEIERPDQSEFEFKESFVSELLNDLIARDIRNELIDFELPTPRYTDTMYYHQKETNILLEFYKRYKSLIKEAFISENKNLLVYGIGKENYKEFIEIIFDSGKKREEETILKQEYLMTDIDRTARISLDETEEHILKHTIN